MIAYKIQLRYVCNIATYQLHIQERALRDLSRNNYDLRSRNIQAVSSQSGIHTAMNSVIVPMVPLNPSVQ